MKPRIVPLVAAFVLPCAALAQIVPTPRATALPVTATSRPFLAARQAQLSVDLAARGYVEEEFLLSGQANIYEWDVAAKPEAAPKVRAANVAYTTRFLLRRPLDVKKFSGRVVVELLNATNQYDIAPLWGLSYEHFLRNGDIYVGLSVKPVVFAALQKFDAQRYAKLSFAYRQPADCATPTPLASGLGEVDPPTSENGLAWDAIAQLGTLLRSSSRDNPLGRYRVQSVLAGGYSQSGGYLITYINALHEHARLGDGSPVYDGYLQAAGSFVAVPLNQCSAPLAADDARLRLGPHDVPVIYVNTQTEYRVVMAQRRADSDAAEDRFRQYELPGVGHGGPWSAGRPALADLTVLERAPFDSQRSCGVAPTDLAANPSYHVLWSWLQNWAAHPQDAAAAPPASRLITVDAAGVAATDAHGNLLGGLRLPFLDLPVATYAGDSPTGSTDPRVQLLCRLAGSMQRFDDAKLKSLYRTKAEYLRQFGLATDALVKEHALLASDAASLKAQAARVSFGP